MPNWLAWTTWAVFMLCRSMTLQLYGRVEQGSRVLQYTFMACHTMTWPPRVQHPMSTLPTDQYCSLTLKVGHTTYKQHQFFYHLIHHISYILIQICSNHESKPDHHNLYPISKLIFHTNYLHALEYMALTFWNSLRWIILSKASLKPM